MGKIIELKDYLTEYNEQRNSNEQPEKFAVSLECAYLENIDILKEFGIVLNKSSQWIVLTIEPMILKKTLLRARDLGFLDAYFQNPRYLRADVDEIIRRISECEANDITIVDESGKYPKWLFSDRAYDYVTGPLIKKENVINKVIDEVILDNNEPRKVANR